MPRSTRRFGSAMLAVDTNVIVRYIADDDPEQSQRARTLVDHNLIFVPMTVLLETVWVLRRARGYAQREVAKALREFAGLPNVSIEDPHRASRALDWVDQGLEFADALHLAASEGCSAFATFDAQLLKMAKKATGIPVKPV